MLTPDASFCRKCGVPIGTATACKECGEQLSDNANFCGNCGLPIEYVGFTRQIIIEEEEEEMKKLRHYNHKSRKRDGSCYFEFGFG